jgi:rhodanese-related sulfurtransferase
MLSLRPRELADLLASTAEPAPERPLLLDVREPHELQISQIEGATLIPLGQLAARLSELERENARLREACRQAAITFRFYEQSHLAKKTQDGDEKAHRNHEMAAMCEAALAGSGEK